MAMEMQKSGTGSASVMSGLGSQQLGSRSPDSTALRGRGVDSEPTDATPAKVPPSRQKDRGMFKHISQVTGTVVSAKGLQSKGSWNANAVYVIVKGIRSNNHLVNIHATKLVFNSLQPQWNEKFNFICPESWGVVELVGLKFLVYDAGANGVNSFQGSDDFLGGCDLDLSSVTQLQGQEPMELEISGCEYRTGSLKAKRPRLTVDFRVLAKFSKRPESPTRAVTRSLEKLTRTTGMNLLIHKARSLPSAAANHQLQCVTRVMMVSGEVVELGRSDVVEGSEDPHFSWQLQADFKAAMSRQASPIDEDFGEAQADDEVAWDEPTLLMIDIVDAGTASKGGAATPLEHREHFGSIIAPFWKFSSVEEKHKLPVGSKSQTIEGKKAREEKAQKAAMRSSRTSNKDGDIFDSGDEDHVQASLCSRLARRAAAPLRTARTSLRQRFRRLRKGGLLRRRDWQTRRLVVSVSLVREKLEMPFAKLIDHPYRISDEDDVDIFMRGEGWKRTLFARPEISHDFTNPAVIRGMHRVVFVSGCVFGASGLANADKFGKSDPFCTIEAIMEDGERRFVHRTPTVKDSLNPSWEEAFFFPVPLEGPRINRLAFTVFDDDEGELAAALSGDGPGDDFLGHVYVDLSKLKNGEVLEENMPLVGARQKKGSHKHAFKVAANLAVEIRVERRVKPVYMIEEDEENKTVSKKHYASRVIRGARYEDPSQQELFTDPERIVAREVLYRKWRWDQGGPPMIENRKLFKDWLRRPDQRPKDIDLDDEEEQEEAVRVQAVGLRSAGVGSGDQSAEALPGQVAEDRPHPCDFNQGCKFQVQKYSGRPPDFDALYTKLGKLDAIDLAKDPSFAAAWFPTIDIPPTPWEQSLEQSLSREASGVRESGPSAGTLQQFSPSASTRQGTASPSTLSPRTLRGGRSAATLHGGRSTSTLQGGPSLVILDASRSDADVV